LKFFGRVGFFAALLALSLHLGFAARPAFALDPGAAADKGTSPSDWANGVIKENSGKWDMPGHVPVVNLNVPYVGLSPGMYEILKHVYEDVLANLESKNPCKAAAIGKAWTKLGDSIFGGVGIAAGKTIVDTIKSIAGLVEMPEAEIMDQIKDQIKDSVKDAVKDKLKDIFKGEKPEVYYSTSVVDDCEVVVLAIWDKAAGTFEVIIYGDCKCKAQSVFMSLQTATLRTFSIKLSGTITLRLVGKTLAMSFHDDRPDVHANCNVCIAPGGSFTADPPPDPPGTTGLTQPPPLPGRDVKTNCKECQPIVDRIMTVYAAIDAIRVKQRAAESDRIGALNAGDKATADNLSAEVISLGLQELALDHELRDLGGKLADCEKNQCNTGHVVVLPGPPVGPPPSAVPGTAIPKGKACEKCQSIRDEIDQINRRLEQANKELAEAQAIQRQGGSGARFEKARDQVSALTKEMGTLGNRLDELTALLAKCEKSCDETEEPPSRTIIPNGPNNTDEKKSDGGKTDNTTTKTQVKKGETSKTGVKKTKEKPKKRAKKSEDSGNTDSGISGGFSFGVGGGGIGRRPIEGGRDEPGRIERR
jgi:hypothetical protein